ncbi:hypothetical protein N665_0826s0004 [Sinapis alba]|nr:hypothetical protein N665_0826s0004 [Sinapis alba]
MGGDGRCIFMANLRCELLFGVKSSGFHLAGKGKVPTKSTEKARLSTGSIDKNDRCLIDQVQQSACFQPAHVWSNVEPNISSINDDEEVLNT